MESELKAISDSLIQRYSDRYKKLGHSIGTLGWGSKEQQFYRFSISSSLIPDFRDKQILDIGCGFGDYFLYLKNEGFSIKSYMGIDINPELILEAKKTIKADEAKFEVCNLLTDDSSHLIKFDYAFMFGILNFNLKEKMDNLEYTKKFLTKAFSLVNEALVFDFISTNVIDTYPKEDFIYYHDPIEVLKFCFELSPNVSLVHDYKSIPQRECTVIVSKNARL